MPRYTLTPLETTILGRALQEYAVTNNLPFADALVLAASTTQAELRAVATAFLTRQRNQRTAQLATIDAETAAAKTNLSADIAAIDALQAKL